MKQVFRVAALTLLTVGAVATLAQRGPSTDAPRSGDTGMMDMGMMDVPGGTGSMESWEMMEMMMRCMSMMQDMQMHDAEGAGTQP